VDDPLRRALHEVKPISMGMAPSALGNATISGTPSIHFAPQITIHAPAGSDPQTLANLLDGQLRRLIREAMRGSSAALHD
jgi:hypothetical protein